MKKFVLFCLATLSFVATWAADFEVDGIYYKILSSSTVEVAQRPSGTSRYSGNVVIPQMVRYDDEDYTVVGIGENAFLAETDMTSAELPSTITYINNWAFESSSLTSINIPEAITLVGDYAFNETPLTSVTLPEGLTSLGEGAFMITKITSINIPKSITYIGSSAFQSCENLQEVTLEEGLIVIGDDMFSECENLQTIGTIPSTVTYIGASAFANTNIKSVYLSKNITEMGEGVFAGCGALNEIILEEGLTLVGDRAFEECEKIVSITIPNSMVKIGWSAFRGLGISTLTLPSNITSIGEGAFADCFNLAEVVFSEGFSMTNISNSMFAGCSSLKSIELPSSITTIEDYAFRYSGLTSIGFPENISTIGEYAFGNCTSLTTITFPETITSIGEYVCLNCTSLKEATILANISKIEASSFYGCTALTKVSIPKTVSNINNQAFYNCKALTSLTSLNREAPICGTSVFTSVPTSTCILYVPNGSESSYSTAPTWENFTNIVGIEVDDDPDEDETKFVEDGIYYQYVDKDAMTVEVTYESSSFNYYSGTIDIPATVTHKGKEYTVIGIGYSAFRLSPELIKVTIPESVTYIDTYAFYDNSALQEVSLPSGITEIGTYTFHNCKSLSTITIPANVTTIGSYAFGNCSFVEFTLEDGEQTLNGSRYALNSSSIDSLYLGRNVVCSSSGYSMFRDLSVLDIIFGEDVTTLCDSEFYKCKGLEKLTIPGHVIEIGEEAFRGCSDIKNVILSEGITSLGDRTFNECTALEEAILPGSINNIGDRIFLDCTNLRKVTIKEGVPKISKDMFENCSSLLEVDLPSNIGIVDNYAFRNCTSLERATFVEGESSYYISMYAFDGCTSLTSILLPTNVTRIAADGFRGCTGLKKVVFPNQTENNSSPFQGCSGLEEVILCAQAQSLNQYIAYNQFNGCTSLSKIYVLSDVAPKVAGANAFTNVPTETCVVYVPVGSRESYIDEDSKWSVFANIVELSEPLPVTYCVGNVTTESAQINGLVAVGSIDVTEVGFEYWAEGDDSPTVIIVSDSFTATDELHATLADLAYGMTYTYRVYAKTASETFYGDEVTFTLPIEGAKVFTLEASSITETTAVLNGRLVLPENESATEQGFVYWEEANANKKEALIIDLGTWTYTLESLSPETTYTYYAFATLASGPTIYGDEVEFTTLEAIETGITNVEANGLEDENIEGYYTPDGRAISAPQSGVNIIHYKDGTAKKILVK